MSFLGWLLYGRLCVRCKAERTGIWDPTLDVLCTTCLTVERINFRAMLEKWGR